MSNEIIHFFNSVCLSFDAHSTTILHKNLHYLCDKYVFENDKVNLMGDVGGQRARGGSEMNEMGKLSRVCKLY